MSLSYQLATSEYELRAWHSFKWICGHFLGNNKSPTYRDGIQNLLHTYHKMGYRMSLKIHFLHSHLDFFPKNLGAVSNERGERFHQNSFRQWKIATKVFGMKVWCQTTVGSCTERIQNKCTRENHTQCVFKFFCFSPLKLFNMDIIFLQFKVFFKSLLHLILFFLKDYFKRNLILCWCAGHY